VSQISPHNTQINQEIAQLSNNVVILANVKNHSAIDPSLYPKMDVTSLVAACACITQSKNSDVGDLVQTTSLNNVALLSSLASVGAKLRENKKLEKLLSSLDYSDISNAEAILTQQNVSEVLKDKIIYLSIPLTLKTKLKSMINFIADLIEQRGGKVVFQSEKHNESDSDLRSTFSSVDYFMPLVNDDYLNPSTFISRELRIAIELQNTQKRLFVTPIYISDVKADLLTYLSKTPSLFLFGYLSSNNMTSLIKRKLSLFVNAISSFEV
jgi:hypothetical protein